MAFIDAPIFEAISNIALLLTKSLPSDEERLARLKLNSPRIYANIRKHILNQIIRECRHKGFNTKETVVDCALLFTTDLPQSEEILFSDLAVAAMGIK